MPDYRLKIKRYNPETDKKPHWEEYKVEADPTDRVLDSLHTVKWYRDVLNRFAQIGFTEPITEELAEAVTALEKS